MTDKVAGPDGSALSEGLGAGAEARTSWRTAYCDAYLAANGTEARIEESAAGWFRVRTDDGKGETGMQYRRKQIEQMTERLRARAAGLSG